MMNKNFFLAKTKIKLHLFNEEYLDIWSKETTTTATITTKLMI